MKVILMELSLPVDRSWKPSLVTSRVFVFSLAATEFGVVLTLLLIIHVLSISIWVYSIVIDFYFTPTNEEKFQWNSKRKRISLAVMVTRFFRIPSLILANNVSTEK